eukprot:1158543-Pelagomonas_calceolata.AAC.4
MTRALRSISFSSAIFCSSISLCFACGRKQQHVKISIPCALQMLSLSIFSSACYSSSSFCISAANGVTWSDTAASASSQI